MQKKIKQINIKQSTCFLIVFNFLFFLNFSFMACRHTEPNMIYMPDMAYSPALKSQQKGATGMPVEGTVPRGYVSYPYSKDPEKAGRELKDPFTPTQRTLARGKHLFESFCYVCHGHAGEGDGPVAAKFGRPPSLQSEKIQNWQDGKIYHVITMGQNLMPSYASQISPEDRWPLIHYIRALQRAQNPPAKDVEIFEQQD